MVYTKDQLAKLQSTLNEILGMIDVLCKRNNIEYFAIAGTLLGTVRHEGFIPWDDDIDIGMMRDDYNRFLEVLKKELPKGYTYVNYEVNKHCPNIFTKVCKEGTTFVEEETESLDIPHCIFVDIMPIDKTSPVPEKRVKHLKQIRFYYQLFKSKSLWKVSSISNKKRKFVGKIVRPLLHVFLFAFSKQKIYKKINNLLNKYNYLDTDCYVFYKGLERGAVPYNWVFPLKVLKFESRSIFVPNEYEKVLNQLYGDYTILPPEEKRQSHCPKRLSF